MILRIEPVNVQDHPAGILLDNILVYEWQAWDGWLISHLIDSRCRVTASYEDPVDVLAERLGAGIDAVLLHINLTHGGGYPRKRSTIVRRCKDKGVTVLNTGVDNISKRNLHRLLLRAGLSTAAAKRRGDPEEWLFVKTDLNWGGEVEMRSELTRQEKFGVGAQPAPISTADDYVRIKRRELAPELWSDRRVVIERFIDNAAGSFYRVYRFGDAVIVVKGHSMDLIKKLCGHVNDLNYPCTVSKIIDRASSLPDRLNETLRRFLLGTDIEFFCLDVLHNDRDYYVVDLNLTPYSGRGAQNADMVAAMQQGISTYLQRGREKRQSEARRV